MPTPTPVISGWFTTDPEPHLIGASCRECGTIAFPPSASWCPSPRCRCTELDEVPLSRRGTIWSFTNAAYQPPPPYVPNDDPYVPFAIAAVELAVEHIVILGQVASGFDLADLYVGQEVELVVETLVDDEERHELTWRWRPVPGTGPIDAITADAGTTMEADR